MLSLTGEINEGDAEFVTLHVYGIIGDGFDQDTITWDGVSNLADSTGDVSLIADNFLAGVGETAEFVGHLTVTQDTEELLLDVTDFVQQFASEDIQFLIAREVRFEEVLNDDGTVRFAGDVIDRSFGAVRFDSSEGSNGPQLLSRTTRRGRHPRTRHRRPVRRPRFADHPQAAAALSVEDLVAEPAD